MSKRLKSFHKLFFIVIFSILFSGVIGSSSSPDLPEKIAPELEQIEALPRRTKPAELNIEVTKIKSEPLEEVYIDRENKNIYVDFSKKREQALRGIKDAEDLEKKYNLIVSESIQGNSEVNGRDKSRNKNNSQIMNYDVVEYDGKKVLKIPYESEPEKLYISIQENGNRQIKKIYTINMANVQMFNTKGIILEERVVIINLQGGIEKWRDAKFVFNLKGTLTFDPTGATNEKTENVDLSKVQIIKSSGFNSPNDEFINSFEKNVKIEVNSPGAKNSGTVILYKGDQNSNEAQFFYKQKPDGTGEGQDGIEIKYLTDGNLTFRFQQIDSIGETTYRLEVKHIEDSTKNIKKHTLIINADGKNELIEVNKITLKYKNGYTSNWYKFDENGNIIENNDNNLNIYKTNNFLKTIPFTPETAPSIKVIDLSSEKNEVILKKLGWYVQNTLNLENNIHITPQFISNGCFEFNLGTKIGYFPIGPKYRVKLEHRNSSGTLIKEQILTIDTEEITEKLQLKLLSGFNKNTPIIFNEVGIENILNATLTSDKNRYLKSLDIESKHNYINNGDSFEINNLGSSENFNVTLSEKDDSNKKLELNIEYKNKYPILKILNDAQAGVYILNINHNNNENEKKLSYTMEILIEETKQLMEINTDLKDIIIDDVENLALNYDFGNLEIEQVGNGDYIVGKNPFPVIALGNEKGDNGWSFSSTLGSIPKREKIFTNYKAVNSSSDNLIEMEMYFENTIVTITNENGGNPTTLTRGNNVIGAFGNSKREKINTKLKGKIANDSFISSFRNNKNRQIPLKSQAGNYEQINFIIGQAIGKDNFTYDVPLKSNLVSGVIDKKIDYRNYPNIIINKPLLEEKLTLNIKELFDLSKPINFTTNGINMDNIELSSDNKRYLKSLHYNSFFNINNGPKKEIISDSEKSNSEDYNITLNNGTDVLVLKVKYENSRYPKLTILGTPNPGKYTMSMKHFDPSELERLNYTLDIIIEPKSAKEFEVTSSMRDIIILPNGKIEIPNNWVNVIQLVSDKGIFPVIGINRPSWVIETDRPLNPIDKRPTAVLNLGAKGEIEIPVNIRETPYQNTEKFFVYDRGDMTNRNIAVGAYTSLSSTSGTGLSNKVRVDFQISLNSLSKEDKDKILDYAKDEFGKDTTKTKVIIPYSATKPEEYHKIYSIRGLQKSTSKIFTVNEDNILSYGVVDFPKIVVLREDKPIEKKAILNFINPIPKTAGDISGTFDLIYGAISPNNLQGYNHPSSLSVDGITSDWYGFTVIPEHHKVQIKVGGTVVKEFMTAENGDIKGTQNIKVNDNEYILLKGQNAPLAIGIKQWDFNQKKDTIVFEHLNSNNRVVARDIYEINLPIFSPIKYLDATNSSLIAKRGSNKDLTVIANARQDFVELGTLKLQNYQKDITKVGNYNTGTELYEKEVRIETILSDLTLESSDKTQLKGTLKFDSNKTSISIPNESATLRFVLSEESKNNTNNIAGKTFTISKPLIEIKGGNNQLESLLEKLTITLKDGQAGKLPNMSFVSTITALTIKENDLGMINKPLPIPGRMTLRQLDGGQGNSVPAIALGLIDDWRVFKGKRNNIINNRKLLETQYTIGNSTTTINLRPELTAPIPSVDDRNGIDGVYIDDSQIKLYQEKDSSGKILTALTYVTRRNTRTERITTGLAIGISTEQLSIIKNAIKNISGDRIELRATGNNAKIAYIHAKDEGTSGVTTESNPLYIPTANPSLDNSYAYENLPSIFIEKENLYKNMEIKLLPTYNQEKITFTSSNIIEPTGGLTEVIPSNDFRVLEGLSYEHKIRLTLPGGQIKEYTTNNNGGTIEDIVETLEKNGKTVKVHLEYLNDKDVKIWITDRNGSQYYDLVLQHIDPSGDIRRTTNLRLTSQVKDADAEFGELDFVISSRYNAIDGQLNSEPLVISSNGISYQSEVLSLSLLSGNYPIHPGIDKKIFISYYDSTGLKEKELTSELEIETLKMKLKLKKDVKTGDISIKPLNWKFNSVDEFTLTYKDNGIRNQYKFNVKCPEFFVASIGVLDFGKIYKIGNPEDKIKETNIELYYNDSTINPTYSLDVSTANPEPNTLYLDDEVPSRLKVVNLNLKHNKIKKEILNNGKGQKVILPLEGIIPKESIKAAKPGKYEKTVQILIHIK